MWQSLYAELKDQGLVVMTVALDTGGADAARPFIERAQPAHPSLIDRRHTVAERYGFVNVPSAVWIDEAGIIVRPTHTPAATAAMASLIGIGPSDYLDAVRDWVANGQGSRFLPARDESGTAQQGTDDNAVRAALNFRLGEYLVERGDADVARPYLEEAARLRPEHWAYRRQAWAILEPPEKNGSLWYEAVMRPERQDVPYYPALALGKAPAADAADTARKQREMFRATFGKMFAPPGDEPP